MAELFQHGRTLRRLINRWRIAGRFGSRARIAEFPSWIQASIRADRDWDDDERQVWGFTGDASSNSLATNFPALAIFAGAREVQVRKIDFLVDVDTGALNTRLEVNLITPPSGYNAVEFNPGQFFPFLQATPVIPDMTSVLSVPNAIVVGGHQTGLMQVTIGGVLVNPAIGPRYRNKRIDAGLLPFGSLLEPLMTTIVDWNDPPLILPPFRQMAVQLINPVAPQPLRLFVNYYFSEREVA